VRFATQNVQLLFKKRASKLRLVPLATEVALFSD
jgi:hypothetical protein